MSSNHYLGQRLLCGGALCTVRYIGRVGGTEGEWLGVEWDDTSKGRHPGFHGKVRYFECQSPKSTAGSFIRPNRVFAQPLSFVEALHKKYASELEEEAKGDKSIEISGKLVEEVGFDKIRRQLAALQELHIVILDGLCVAGLRSQPWSSPVYEAAWQEIIGLIAKTCPVVTELDLSRSLLEQWADVVGICSALPLIKSLKLDGNRFYEIATLNLDNEFISHSFGGIRELSLDDTLLTYDQIKALTANFPSLTTLSLAFNNLVNIPTPLDISKLTTLTLSSNAITEISDLGHLTVLPNLTSLTLRSNQIASISSASSDLQPTAPPLIFHTLTTLDLSRNLIATFSLISHLSHHFPNLCSLRVSDNPIFSSLPTSESSPLTIARISTLTILNFSQITSAQRLNAELYYLSRIAKELAAAPEANRQIIIDEHPRWKELCSIHGTPSVIRTPETTIPANTTSGIEIFAARLINFTFYRQPTITPSMTNDLRTRHIPRSTSIYRLKFLVGRLFDLPPTHIRLVWETGERDPLGRSLAKDDEARWNVSSEEEEEDDEEELDEDSAGVDQSAEGTRGKNRGRWVAREVELEDGMRDVGFWIEGREAKVRVENRGRYKLEP